MFFGIGGSTLFFGNLVSGFRSWFLNSEKMELTIWYFLMKESQLINPQELSIMSSMRKMTNFMMTLKKGGMTFLLACLVGGIEPT